jgi:hypothetical protein
MGDGILSSYVYPVVCGLTIAACGYIAKQIKETVSKTEMSKMKEDLVKDFTDLKASTTKEVTDMQAKLSTIRSETYSRETLDGIHGRFNDKVDRHNDDIIEIKGKIEKISEKIDEIPSKVVQMLKAGIEK